MTRPTTDFRAYWQQRADGATRADFAYTTRCILGRTVNGTALDAGRYHATEIPERDFGLAMGPAICGARPGGYAIGWSGPQKRAVNCPTCLAELKRRAARATPELNRRKKTGARR